MTHHEDFAERLKHSFEGALREPNVSIHPGDFTSVLVSVVSPTFEGMDEGRRQEIVWERIFRDLDQDERRRIEFIYTDAPSEIIPAASFPKDWNAGDFQVPEDHG